MLFKALEIRQYTKTIAEQEWIFHCPGGFDNLIGTENTNMTVERNERERKRTGNAFVVEDLLNGSKMFGLN